MILHLFLHIIKNMFSIRYLYKMYSQMQIFKFVIPPFLLNIILLHNLHWSFLCNLLENKFKLFNNITTFTRMLKYNYISMY